MPVSSVMRGLAVLGLVIASIFVVKSMIRETDFEAQEASRMRGDCIYQVFHDQNQLGIARFREPTRTSTILASLNVSVPERLKQDDPLVPCNSVLEVSREHADIPWHPVKAETILTLGGKIDLNTAQEEDLIFVPGIGSGLAKKIVEYRRKNGSFQSVEDLEQVTGVGRKTRKKFEEYLKILGHSSGRPSP